MQITISEDMENILLCIFQYIFQYLTIYSSLYIIKYYLCGEDKLVQIHNTDGLYTFV
jgi:hypothetical protein